MLEIIRKLDGANFHSREPSYWLAGHYRPDLTTRLFMSLEFDAFLEYQAWGKG